MADTIVDYRHKGEYESNSKWPLVTLLLVPAFFLFGWVANDVTDQTFVNNPEAGVGGGPGTNLVTPTPLKERIVNPIPTDEILEDLTPPVEPNDMEQSLR